jgi:hypothetical protein
LPVLALSHVKELKVGKLQGHAVKWSVDGLEESILGVPKLSTAANFISNPGYK